MTRLWVAGSARSARCGRSCHAMSGRGGWLAGLGRLATSNGPPTAGPTIGGPGKPGECGPDGDEGHLGPAAQVLGFASRWRSPNAATPHASTAVGTSCGAEPSTTAEMSTLSAATDAQGVHPTASCRPVPGRGTYVARVAPDVTATRTTSAVQPAGAGAARPPASPISTTASTGDSTATATIRRGGQAARTDAIHPPGAPARITTGTAPRAPRARTGAGRAISGRCTAGPAGCWP